MSFPGSFLSSLLKRQHISNILITLILSFSLVIFGLYLVSREKNRTETTKRESAYPARIYDTLLKLQNRFYPIILSGDAVSRMTDFSSLNADKADTILKSLSSMPLLGAAEGIDLFDARESVLYSRSGGSMETDTIQNSDKWVTEVLKKPNTSKLDILYLPDAEKLYLYLRFPIYGESGAYNGFFGLRYLYTEMSTFCREALKERQSMIMVNRNGQILFEPGQDTGMFSGSTGPVFLSQNNPRQYIGDLSPLIGLEEDRTLSIADSRAELLHYYPVIDAYLIIEDQFFLRKSEELIRNITVAAAIGLFILFINVYTVFSYQRIILAKNKRLAELIQEKDLFLSLMSHNVNNTISVLSNDLHHAIREKQELSFQRKMILLSWIDTTKRLISNIIFYLRHVDRGNFVIRTEPVQMEDLLQTLLLRNREKAELKSQTLILEIQHADVTVGTDRNLLLEVLDNLIDNAIKYSPMEGSITIRLDTNASGETTVTISDTGPGFTAEDRAGLFQPFKKGSARPTGGEQSTGIGLYVAHSLIRKLNGTLSLADPDENSNIGAQFVLTLPPNIV